MSRKNKHMFSEMRELIIKLHKENKSICQVAKITGKTRSTVQSLIKISETVETASRSGRPKVLNKRTERNVTRPGNLNSRISASKIAVQVELDTRKKAKYKGEARKKPSIGDVNHRRRYNGHGNGSQFFSSDKIQKLRINSVVLLFGCGSVKYTSLGPQVELYGSNQMYLIACSPCVVGMLWEVTDFDTDCLSTEFWSIWLPKTSRLHWTDIDKKKWELTGEIEPSSVKEYDTTDRNEPELLRALSKARKGARQYLTQASCVARGIPVKIKS